MAESGVQFGTSGARGLVESMTDRVCYAYTSGFLSHLTHNRGLSSDATVRIAGDRRSSTLRIMQAVARAALDAGFGVENCGLIPSPAVALRGLSTKSPAIMVTGSHIPDDRNGIKFNSANGEVTKEDEAMMRALNVQLPSVFDDVGMLTSPSSALPEPAAGALSAFAERYTEAFAPDALSGLKLGVYGHSAVGRDFLVDLYSNLGALVTPLGFSDSFIPVDTEAIRSEDVELAHDWARNGDFDAILSTDGDSDRPLIADETGKWIRGDVAGVLVARFLNADAVATPVSCNTCVESSAAFQRVIRTRIGSPYVIAGMEEAVRAGHGSVVGYEANGGFLMQTSCRLPGGNTLPALPTRDAVIVHLALLLSAKERKLPLSKLVAIVGSRVTASDRDPGFATERSVDLMSRLSHASNEELSSAFELGPVERLDFTDGCRLTFGSGEIVHLRPSGNAPELRCYAEADSEARAEQLVAWGLRIARRLAPGG